MHAEAGPEKRPTTWRARLVVSAEGLSGRLAKSLGLVRREDRPLGVAVRRYVRTPRTSDDYLDIYFDLTDRGPSRDSMPGYGWIFGMGDGSVNVGLGVLNTSKAFGRTDYKALLTTWMAGTPDECVHKLRTDILPTGINHVIAALVDPVLVKFFSGQTVDVPDVKSQLRLIADKVMPELD